MFALGREWEPKVASDLERCQCWWNWWLGDRLLETENA